MTVIHWKPGHEPGASSVTQQTRVLVADTSGPSHWSPVIPSFVENCKRSLRHSKRVRSEKQDRTNMRTAARVDSNQSAIVKALRSAGAFVQPLHTIGDGCPDLLVAYRGKWHLLEIKDGDKPPSQRKLTVDELEWHGKASRHAPVFIAENIEDALVAIGAVTLRD
jgi:hypothetical protein